VGLAVYVGLPKVVGPHPLIIADEYGVAARDFPAESCIPAFDAVEPPSLTVPDAEQSLALVAPVIRRLGTSFDPSSRYLRSSPSPATTGSGNSWSSFGDHVT
jgi:hypothetical protein